MSILEANSGKNEDNAISLRTKIVRILVLLVALYAAFNFGLQRYVILPSFEALERHEAMKDLLRCENALRREVERLDELCADWIGQAPPDAQVFDRSGTPRPSGLTPAMFHDSALDLVYFFDSAGNVLWGRAYGLDTGEPVAVPGFPKQRWAATHPLLNHKRQDSAVRGIFSAATPPLLVSSRPISGPNEASGLRGTLIVGRFLSNETLERLREETQVQFEVWPLSMSDLPVDTSTLGALAQRGETRFVEGDDELQVYSAFVDVLGKPALLFRVHVARNIMARGRAAMNVDSIGNACAALIVLLMLVVLMRRTVTDPLGRLTAHVTGITRGDELILYEAGPYNDEIGTLGRELNQMIRRLKEDLEERRKAEDALRESEARMRTILATAPDGIFTMDEAGIIETANLAASEMFGYERGELPGRSISSIIQDRSKDNPSGLQAFFTPGADSAPRSDREVTGLRKDQSTMPVHLRVSSMRLGERRIFTGIVRDISELKEMNERVLRSKHLATIGEMGASVAHEIRNPLAGMSGAIQVILNDLPKEYKHKEVLEEVLEMVGRVENTVRQLLDYAKAWRPEPRAFAVMEELRDISRQAETKEEFADIVFAFEGDDAIELFADPTLFCQVLWNLLSNAAQAMPEGGEARWSVCETEDLTEVTLEDSGCGVTPETEENLFQPFFTTKVHGTGLGLAICRRILEAHQGAIEIVSAPEGGTTVKLSFPKGGIS